MDEIASGMPVYDATGDLLGSVEATHADSFQVAGRAIPRAAVARVAEGNVQLLLARSAFMAHQEPSTVAHGGDNPLDGGIAADAEGRIVVPIVEERIQVGTRQVTLGEIEIRKRVIEETRMMPVTIRREIVEIVRRDANGAEVSVEEIKPTAQAQPTN